MKPQALAKSQVLARSRVPIAPEKSFYPVFRQTPRETLQTLTWISDHPFIFPRINLSVNDHGFSS